MLLAMINTLLLVQALVLAISLDIMALTMLSLGILNIPLVVPVYQSAA